MRAIDEIPYESGAYYIFDRGYNDFKRLYNIHCIEAKFVMRAKKNIQFTSVKYPILDSGTEIIVQLSSGKELVRNRYDMIIND